MINEITRRYELIAGHFLPNVPETHKCKRPHGHNYELEISVRGPLDAKLAWIIDYWDLDKIVQPVLDTLDHRMLNDIKGLENPTAEIISAWLMNKLLPLLPEPIFVSRITVYETRDCAATTQNDGKPWSTL